MDEKPTKQPLVLSPNDLRRVVGELIAESIEMHRQSREIMDETYRKPTGQPTEQEIDNFILCNPLYDGETASQLTDPGLLGFNYPKASLSQKALRIFHQLTTKWARTNEWLGADLVPYHSMLDLREPDRTELWVPNAKIEPTWFSHSPSALLLAADLLRKGQLLSELDWRTFEKLIGDLLEREGYHVEVTRGSKDGGIDIIASLLDPNIGMVRTIWQAKKYAPSNKVRLAEVRELSGLIARPNVTKGVIVTTSHLTQGALDWIKKDVYRLAFKEKGDVEDWVLKNI